MAKIIKRDVFNDLIGHLDKKEISLIIGARQVGKTTLMNFLKDYLEKRGDKSVYLSLDFENDRKYFNSQNNLINKLKLEFGERRGYVFIDEIQRKTDAGIFLKGIYDMDLPYKFIISGSGSVELKEKVDENWRKGVEYIYTQMNTIFEEYGVKPVGEAGDSFDPNIHQSIDVVETDKKELEHKIATMIQKGYKIGERVIRAARVNVYEYKEKGN